MMPTLSEGNKNLSNEDTSSINLNTNSTDSVAENVKNAGRERRGIRRIIKEIYLTREMRIKLRKTLVFVCLVLLMIAMVSAGISISSTSVPWTKSDIGYQDPVQPQISKRIVRAGLLSYDQCYGSIQSFNDDTDPFSCSQGGKWITVVISLGLICGCVGILFVFFRAKKKI